MGWRVPATSKRYLENGIEEEYQFMGKYLYRWILLTTLQIVALLLHINTFDLFSEQPCHLHMYKSLIDVRVVFHYLTSVDLH